MGADRSAAQRRPGRDRTAGRTTNAAASPHGFGPKPRRRLHANSRFATSLGAAWPAPVSEALRHHSGAPSAIYAWHGLRRPALLAAVSNAEGDLCAVEVTYLDSQARRSGEIAVSRKTFGVLPSGCAVRLDTPGAELLVGEGVFTTLSASGHFDQPAWAMLSAGDMRTWRPPQGVRRVIIAADRGIEGERSAEVLKRRLASVGVSVRTVWPKVPANDWNDACVSVGRTGEGQGSGLLRPSRRRRVRP